MISHSVIVHVKEERKIKNLGYFCFVIDVSTIYYRRLNHREKYYLFTHRQTFYSFTKTSEKCSLEKISNVGCRILFPSLFRLLF